MGGTLTCTHESRPDDLRGSGPGQVHHQQLLHEHRGQGQRGAHETRQQRLLMRVDASACEAWWERKGKDSQGQSEVDA